MIETKPKAIFYDWDGTLSDSDALIRDVHNRVRVAFGLDALPPEIARRTFIRAADEAYKEVYGDRWKQAYDLLYQIYESEHIARLNLFASTLPLLETAAGKGIKQGIASNKRGQYLRDEITASNTSAFFGPAVFGSGDVARGKPAPDMLLAAAAAHGVDAQTPADIWYVGDNHTDMAAAAAAGFLPVLVFGSEQARPMAAVQFETLDDCLDCVRKLP